MVKRMVFVLVALFFLSLSNLVGAEEPAKEKPLPTELPIVVVKGTDRSYLEVMRTRTLSFMPIRGEKSMIDYFLQVTLGKKTYSHFLSFPGLERRVEERVKERLPSAEGFIEGFMEERKEISPIVLLEPRLSRLSVSYTPARYITTRVKALSFMPIRGEKSLTEVFVQFPPRERAYRPLSKEESPLPYLYISASLAAYDNFNYRLDYGRKKDKMIHFLSLGRYSAPQWITYEKDGSALGKDEDWLNTRFIWDFGQNKNALFSIKGYQKKMDLPEEKERKKDKVGLAGKLTFNLQGGNILKFTGWAENTEVEDEGVSYQDFNPGAQLELEIPQVPLNVGIRAENSSYADKSQFHLWIKDEAIVLKFIKGLSLGLEVGIKKVEGVTSEVLPRLKLTEQFNPKLRLQVGAEREFYLPEFDDLYLSRDYIDINEELDKMVKLWNYEAQLKYELSSVADLSLGGFYNRGEDIIWNWDSANSLVRPEIRNMSSWGVKLDLLLHVGETLEQGISYTYQKAENLDDPGKVIPHYPQNMVDIWLIWSTGGWKINMGSEFIDKRYYEENIDDEIPDGWKHRFEISRMIGENLEVFIEFLLNNNYYLWKDYKPSAQTLYFGLKGKLY